MKLLAVGDMHLGRPPVALPEDLRGRAAELGPEAAWQRAVDAAAEHQVGAVLLAGDVVDRNRDFFVAYGDLKAGVERLTESGIPVIAVAGNHDTEVLPRLASEIPELHLLGAGGRWELHELDGIGVLGWSFPTTYVHTSPLENLESEFTGRPRGDGPLIGLLHCDRDQPGSRYGPVSSAELEAAPVDAWLLGHVHQPDELCGRRPIGYLGSITALRASETGPRGPWLVETRGDTLKLRHLPLAPLRYAGLAVDVSGLEQPDGLFAAILAAARERIETFLKTGGRPDVLGLRVVLEGRTRFGAALAEQAAELTADSRSFNESGLEVFIHKIEPATLPEIDLPELAERTDPAGLLARDLLALADPDSERRAELIGAARHRLAALTESREFRSLETGLDDAAVAAWLERGGRIALTRLIEQRGAGQ